MTKWESEKTKLMELIEQGVPYDEIGKMYGCSGANIRKVSTKLGIVLPKRRSVNECEHFNKGKGAKKYCLNCNSELGSYAKKFCSPKCQREHEYKEWKKDPSIASIGNWGQVSKHLRRYMFNKYHNKCCKCGWGETNPYTDTIPLELDHIDGNYLNNTEENLQLLCPNCHSLTSTYRGANRGKGREITWLPIGHKQG